MSRPTSCFVIAALLVTGSLVIAGDLNPPAGPVAPTMKTLDEVEARTPINATNTPGDTDSLYKITQPGSYYLTGNITGVVGKHGIEIVSSGVTLDLNGFDLVGVPGMGAFDGVSVTVDSLRGITVRDGSVRNWGDGGVDLGFLSRGCRVEGVVTSGNTGTGITASISASVTGCTSSFNGQRGIRASNGSTISHCSVESNTGAGIEVNNGCAIANCSAYLNTAHGMLTGVGCTVIDSSGYQNTLHGLQVGEGGTVTRCTVYTNGGRGINAGDGCTVTECTSNRNSNTGITVGAGGTIKDCTARLNTLNGISCAGRSRVIGNTCDANGNGGDGAGILASGTDSRIEDNLCTANDRGIDIDGFATLIVRNTCSANTVNWDVNIGNVCLVVTVFTTPAFSGNAGGTAPGSTDPSANFTL